MKRTSAAGAVLVASLCMCSGAEYPLAIGTVWDYGYRNTVTYPMGGSVVSNVTVGRMTTTIVGMYTTNDVEYFKAETDYHGLFNLPKQVMLLREDATGVYAASDLLGKFLESRTLALPLEEGARWEYDDGSEGWRQVEGRESVDVEGHRYADCFKIGREFKDPSKAGTIKHTAWYQPGVGEVRFILDQTVAPGTTSKSETILTSFKTGP